jgi:hypothetical protein
MTSKQAVRFKMNKKGGWDIEPAAVVPAQMGHKPQLTPEQRLCWAVLEMVQHDLGKLEKRAHPGAHKKLRRSLREEALHYIYADEHYWFFSFDNVCAQVGIDPDAYRSAIERKGQAA